MITQFSNLDFTRAINSNWNILNNEQLNSAISEVKSAVSNFFNNEKVKSTLSKLELPAKHIAWTMINNEVFEVGAKRISLAVFLIANKTIGNMIDSSGLLGTTKQCLEDLKKKIENRKNPDSSLSALSPSPIKTLAFVRIVQAIGANFIANQLTGNVLGTREIVHLFALKVTQHLALIGAASIANKTLTSKET